MSLRPGDAFAFEFQVTAADGALTDADSAPTGTVVRNGDDDATPTVTIANKATGRYKASGTVPSGYAAGDVVQVRLAATVGGVATGGVQPLGVLDSARVGEVSAQLAQQVADEGTITTGAAAGATSLTLPTGLAIAAGSLLLFQGTARAAAYVEAYTSGTGATTLRDPGLSAAVADGEDFVAYQAADVPSLELGSDGRTLVSADAHTAGATIAGIAGTKTTLDDLNDLDAAQVNAEADTAIADAGLESALAAIAGYLDTEIATIIAALTAIQGATFDTATDSLEAIRNRGDAAWTTGAGGSAPTVEEIRAEIDANSTQLAALLTALTTVDGLVDQILVDTGTDIPALIAALNNLSAADVTAAVPTAVENAAAVRTELTTELGRIDGAISTLATPGAAMTLTPGERGTLASQILSTEEGTDGVSLEGLMRLLLAFIAGPVTGADGDAATISFRNPSGDIVRLSMTVDANGNRAAAGTLDLN